MRRAMMLAMAMIVGCGGPKFESEADEIAYLKSLPGPTPGQFQRRLSLQREYIEGELKEIGRDDDGKDSSGYDVNSRYEKLVEWIGDDAALKPERDKVRALHAWARLGRSRPRGR